MRRPPPPYEEVVTAEHATRLLPRGLSVDSPEELIGRFSRSCLGGVARGFQEQLFVLPVKQKGFQDKLLRFGDDTLLLISPPRWHARCMAQASERIGELCQDAPLSDEEALLWRFACLFQNAIFLKDEGIGALRESEMGLEGGIHSSPGGLILFAGGLNDLGSSRGCEERL